MKTWEGRGSVTVRMSEYGMSYDMYGIVLQGRAKTVRVIAMKKCFHMECYRCEVREWGRHWQAP